MTTDEILNLYKFAKDPIAELTIISQLTAKPVKEIISIIREAGYEVDDNLIKNSAPRATWTRWTLEEDNRLIECHFKNMSAAQIGIILSRTRDAVCSRIKKLKRDGLINA